MPEARPPADSLLVDSALDRLWDVVAERLQRKGLSPEGAVTLDSLTTKERFALAGLLGRPVTSPRVRVELAVLDDRLRTSGQAAGLVAAMNLWRGPLVDRRGERDRRAARREAVWTSWRAQLAELGLDQQPWCEEWARSLRRLIGGNPRPSVGTALEAATRCLAWLHAGRQLVTGRGELAARLVGGSHGLDDGSLVATMVLRGLAAQHAVPVPANAEDRRVLWERAGILCDEVSTTVLCYGLVPPRPLADPSGGTERRDGGEPAGGWLGARSAAGWETHLSLRDLRRLDRVVSSGTEVFVCENPRVLEAAMEAGSRAAIVCTAGNPTLVVTRLLERLVGEGARLHYRGDFDWPGLSIANRVVERFGAVAWRMSADDYEAALAAAGSGVVDMPRLEGRPVAASWDAGLGPAMERAGRAVHEERLLELLVGDLDTLDTERQPARPARPRVPPPAHPTGWTEPVPGDSERADPAGSQSARAARSSLRPSRISPAPARASPTANDQAAS